MLVEKARLAPPGSGVTLQDGARISWNDLAERGVAIRGSLPNLQGADVAMATKSPLDFFCFLFCLEGYASSVALLPIGGELAPEVQARYSAQTLTAPGASLLVSQNRNHLDSRPHISDPKTESLICRSEIALQTSGTTGRPKLVRHLVTALCSTAKSRVEDAQEYTWGLLYDPSRFAGLQVVLQALLSGSNLAVPRDSRDVISTVDFFSSSQVSHLSATPTYWRKVFMSGKAAEMRIRSVTMGGEIADQAILDAALRAYPGCKVRHVYASTEAGVGFSVNDGRSGFPKSWLIAPPNNIELSVVNETGATIMTGEGQLCIKSGRQALGYVGESRSISSSGWVETGDRVFIDEDRVLFLGRSGGCINVGGNKVYPETIESVLRELPEVVEAHVSGLPSSLAGMLVLARVKVRSPETESDALKGRIMRHARAKLPRHCVPSIVSFVRDFGLGSTGKLSRNTRES